MYVQRLVIDANCINAKGRMSAMNELEEYHRAGLVEILKTSTLNAEFATAPLQRDKADNYIMIGGSQFIGEDGWDATFGAVSGKSQFYDYFLEIFGAESTGRHRVRSIRDCLHIDQAILNNANYLVTNEKVLMRAGVENELIKNNIKILSPESCLADIKTYFEKNYGTSCLSDLENEINLCGPVILGSNSSYGFKLVDPESKEVLLSLYIEKGRLVVEAVVRNSDGDLILEISKGGKPLFHSDGARISCIGKGPVAMGDKSFVQICVASDSEVYLSARYLSSGRVLFDRANLYSIHGTRSMAIDRESMILKGLSLNTPD